MADKAPVTPPSANQRSSSHAPRYQHQRQQSSQDPNTTALFNDGDKHDHFSIPHLDATPTSFSPSKARAQARQTHQLAVLKTWLHSLLPSPSSLGDSDSAIDSKINALISSWETEYLALLTTSNSSGDSSILAADQLRAFQDLMFANQSGDERRRLLHAARAEELENLRANRGLEAEQQSIAEDLIQEIVSTLSDRARESLYLLAESAVLLGVVPKLDRSGVSVMEELGQAVIQQTVEAQKLNNVIESFLQLQRELDVDIDVLRKRLQNMRDAKADNDVKTERMQAQTAQWTRETKQILLKIQEYRDRISTLERTRPGYRGDVVVRVEEVVEIHQRVQQRRDVVGDLEERVKAFHGLPPDLQASRQEVKRAKAELEMLKMQREQLFEQMTSR